MNVIQLGKSGLSADLETDIRRAVPRMEGWCSTEKAIHLAQLVMSHRPHIIVEIGVFAGRSMIPMAMALRELGRGTIIGVDPWAVQESIATVPKDATATAHEGWWNGVDHAKLYNDTIRNTQIFGVERQCQLQRCTSAVAASTVEEIDMWHCDGGHATETAIHDISLWLPKLKPGGIVVMDDIQWESVKSALGQLQLWCNDPLMDCVTYAVGVKRGSLSDKKE